MYSGGATTAAIYGLTSKARCIAAQAPRDGGEEDDAGGGGHGSRFLVGTLSLREENEVHLIEVDETNPDAPSVQEVAIYAHPGEIWALSPSPADPSLLWTASALDGVPRCTLWRLPPDTPDAPSGSLAELAQAPASDGPVKAVLWNPHNRSSVAILDAHNVRLASIDGGALKEAAVVTRPELRFTTARWSPLQEHVVATASDTAVRGWDLRQKSATDGTTGSSGKQAAAFSIDRTHADNVRDFDFNPNSLFYLATGGDDCKVRIWDTRKVSKPVRTLSGHSHWVWNVRYNPYHDELLVSSGSDGRVVLWNVASVSSKYTGAPALKGEDVTTTVATTGSKANDGPIKVYEEHEDSVYGLAWGSSPSSSLWNFVSLSYAGRVVVNYVPREFADLLNA